MGAAVHVPRLPLRRDRRLAGRAHAPTTSTRRRRATPTWRAPAGSSAPTNASTACTRTSCGACAATSSTSPPTARSATSGSAGPATSRCSRPPPRSSTTAPASCESWLRRPRRRADATTAPCRSSMPRRARLAAGRRRRLGRRRRHRAVGALRALRRRRRCSRAQYDSMRALGRPERRRWPGDDRLWTGGFQFGDWLDPAGAARRPGRRQRTDPHLVADRLLLPHRSTCSRQAAEVLGATTTPSATTSSADEVRAAFAREFVTADRPAWTSDAQTAYALAIAFDLLATDGATRSAPASAWPSSCATSRLPHRHRLRRHAARLRRARRHRRTSTPRTSCCSRPSCPSWLYPVTMGATTIWERWDSMLPDGTHRTRGEMTSFNHYALGAVADWLHRGRRRPRPRRTRLPRAPHRAAAGRGPPSARAARHALRPGLVVVELVDGKSSYRGRAAEHHGARRPLPGPAPTTSTSPPDHTRGPCRAEPPPPALPTPQWADHAPDGAEQVDDAIRLARRGTTPTNAAFRAGAKRVDLRRTTEPPM